MNIRTTYFTALIPPRLGNFLLKELSCEWENNEMKIENLIIHIELNDVPSKMVRSISKHKSCINFKMFIFQLK